MPLTHEHRCARGDVAAPGERVIRRRPGLQFQRAQLHSSLMTVYGHVERVTSAVAPIGHMLALRVEDHSPLPGNLLVASNDFH